ncbi:hypothetical protein I3760_05G231400, partial [Carya illinoinensis]
LTILINYCAPSSCGNIPNISYSFRLVSDPTNCGDGRRYELSCENHRTVLSLSGRKYYVRKINYNNNTIRIVDSSIQEANNYSFVPLYFLNYGNWSYFRPYFPIYEELKWNASM